MTSLGCGYQLPLATGPADWSRPARRALRPIALVTRRNPAHSQRRASSTPRGGDQMPQRPGSSFANRLAHDDAEISNTSEGFGERLEGPVTDCDDLEVRCGGHAPSTVDHQLRAAEIGGLQRAVVSVVGLDDRRVALLTEVIWREVCA